MAVSKFGFKTGYLQHTIMLGDINVSGELVVGQLCSLSGKTLAAKSAPAAEGDYIVAQSDETIGYGHIPVENRDYRYSDKVAAGNPKTVVLYRVTDVTDLVEIPTT